MRPAMVITWAWRLAGTPGSQKSGIHFTFHMGPRIQRDYQTLLCLHHCASLCSATSWWSGLSIMLYVLHCVRCYPHNWITVGLVVIVRVSNCDFSLVPKFKSQKLTWYTGVYQYTRTWLISYSVANVNLPSWIVVDTWSHGQWTSSYLFSHHRGPYLFVNMNATNNTV